jgi:hypothetical protein
MINSIHDKVLDMEDIWKIVSAYSPKLQEGYLSYLRDHHMDETNALLEQVRTL